MTNTNDEKHDKRDNYDNRDENDNGDDNARNQGDESRARGADAPVRFFFPLFFD
jgi:hypothetical protein